jgi:tetratricopeptide (TPR) repeat protein
MEELLKDHAVGRADASSLGERTAGALLVGVMLGVGEISAGLAKDPRASADALLRKQSVLDSLLGERTDPAAKRIRARFARLCGVALLGAKEWSRAAGQLEQAAALGYEPRFRLLRDQARAALGGARTDQALLLSRERVAVLEAHNSSARGAKDPSTVVVLELNGYPLQPALLDPVRCEAHLDLARVLLAAGDVAEAGKVCTLAAKLDTSNAEALLLVARVHQARGQLAEARRAVFKGLRSVREETIRKQFRMLLKELGPN